MTGGPSRSLTADGIAHAAEGISVESVLVEAGREGALGASVVVENGSVVVVKKAEVKTSVVEGGRRVEGEYSEVCGVALESILEAIEELKRCFVSEVNDLKSVVKKQEIAIRSLKCGGGGVSGVSGEAHARDVPGWVPERDVPRATTKAPSKSPGIGEWKVVDHGGDRPKEIKVNNDHVVCKNSFQVLSGLQKEDTEVRTVDDKSLPKGKILVVGDSQIRHLDSRFCDRDGMRMKSGRAVTAGKVNYEGLGRHLVEISGVGGIEGKEGPKISAAAAGKANYTGLERHLEVINDGNGRESGSRQGKGERLLGLSRWCSSSLAFARNGVNKLDVIRRHSVFSLRSRVELSTNSIITSVGRARPMYVAINTGISPPVRRVSRQATGGSRGGVVTVSHLRHWSPCRARQGDVIRG
ncbi:hypothetical protein GWK47_044995 [Chionoecetes opilio]|uniref:Uncharacterized protein n=1 Tax=Chionoecetes opilio TaxID=41210 RepID=A0A8J4YFZ1_CHIOP|nr:hypothetical protein GWK47_044995 [Chionoecetes opilio]